MSQPPESQGLSGPSDADVWDEIERETGFVTYKDYLDLFLWADGSIRASLGDLHYSLVALPQEKYSVRARCYFIDLSETRSLSTSSLDFSDHSPHDDSTKLLTALRKPSPQASFRMLLLQPHYPLHPKLVDAIGLGLRIWPQFFEECIARNKGEIIHREYLRSIPMRERHGTIARTTFTVARDYLPGRPNCPPVILMMSHLEAVKKEFSRPLQKPGLAIGKLSNQVEWPEIFEQLFIGHMKQYGGPSLDMKAVLICALLPLLELFFDDLGLHYDNAKRDYFLSLEPQDSYCMRDDIDQNEMERTRFKLRRLVRDSEQCVSDLRRYLRTQDIVEPEYHHAFRTIADEANLWLDDARALEAEIRDKLQLQVGSLALEESKKSIQMTNVQIEESKRVKVVTILAFVYVPLNLATSIFGMNIQQLNHSGQHIRVFLITALVALLLTFFVWLCIVQVTSLIQWREQCRVYRENDQLWPKRGTNYHFLVRVGILYMLLRQGRGRWTWISGAWIRIVTNERAGFDFGSYLHHGRYMLAFCGGLSACDYVCCYQGVERAFDPDSFKRARNLPALHLSSRSAI